jgi:hypothetical protein
VRIYSYQGGGLWAEAIKLATFKGQAHTELFFEKYNIFFSSTLETGPRFATYAQLVSQNPADWLVTDLGVTDEDEEYVYNIARMIEQQTAIYGSEPTYNEEGIVKNFLPVPLIEQNPQQYFCSQVVVTACQAICLFLNEVPCMMSPGYVVAWLNKHLLAWQALRFKINEGMK